MLTLPIKQPWFDLIRRGEKLEEYRNSTPYWQIRFEKAFGATVDEAMRKKTQAYIRFRNGYGPECPSFDAVVTLRHGRGRREWGADPETDYFILEIQKVIEGRK